ncbi:MAG: HAD family hydrolase [Treponema sp.]|nr:HAD family hydrolase [Treponema sp.]
MQNNISAVAFDLDGTLYPNYRLNLRLLPFILREWRLLSAFGKARDAIRAGQEQNAGGKNGGGGCFYKEQARLTAGFLKADPLVIEEKIEKFIYRGWEPIFTKIKLFPYVPETLCALKERGFKLGLLSDFPPNQKLANLGIGGLWDAVLCSEEINALKPDPRPFEALIKALDCAPEQILYVGNSRRYDVAGAKRAGMRAAWVRFTADSAHNADFVFRDYRQLRKYMLD